MYTSYYKMSAKPFESRPDATFFWFGERHKEILSAIETGIYGNNGFQLLTGDAGVGKTILLRELLNGLGDGVQSAVIDNPRTDVLSLYNEICQGFGIEKEITSKVQFLIELSHFLKQIEERGIKALLVIDNAHRLDQELLEEVRTLSNIEKDDGKLLDVLLVGRSKFMVLLSLPRNRVVRQRLTYQADLAPLGKSESADYIRHRLGTVHCYDEIFPDDSLELIHKYSNGIPSRINDICERSLRSGAEKMLETIDVGVITDCIREQGGNGEDRNQLMEQKKIELPEENEEVLANEGGVIVIERLSDIPISEEQDKPPEKEDDVFISRDILFYGGFGLALLLVISVFFLTPKLPSSNWVKSPVSSTVIKNVEPEPETREVKIIVPGATSPGQSLGSIEFRAAKNKSASLQLADEKEHQYGTESAQPATKIATSPESTEKPQTTKIVLGNLVIK